MNDADLAARPARPGPVMAEGVAPAVRRRVLAWAMEELSAFRLRPQAGDAALAQFKALNARSRTIFVYSVSGGLVTLLEKPAEIEVAPTPRRRSFAYLDFFRAVCRLLPEAAPFHFAMDTGDKATERTEVPLFVFQKRLGDASVLLPDIDFLNHDFYAGAKFDDPLGYREKSAKAIFVGSTSGGRVTPEAARACSTPRLRAARFFNGNAQVEFFLPQIVQTTGEDAADILRQMAFCQKPYMGWPEQLQRRFVISMDGNGATCSRVVIALKSNSVLLKYHSDDVLYYFRHLQPWLHYVPIAQDADVGAVLDMERASPAFFESIAENGRHFAAEYLSRDAVFAYTAELFKLYGQCFAQGGAAEIAVPPPAPVPAIRQMEAPATPAGDGVFVAHVQGRGDVVADARGWIGDAKEGRGIEGFSFSFGDAQANHPFFYRVLGADGSAQPLTPAGTYCGTRGQAKPIHGFSVVCPAPSANAPRVMYEGIFRDGFSSGPLGLGVSCRSPRNAPLVAMRIVAATG